MSIDDEKLKQLCERYGIEVTDEAVAEETRLRVQQRLHQLKYEGLATGSFVDYYFADPDKLYEELLPESRSAVIMEALIKAIIDEHGLTVSSEELESEAEEVAKRQNATVEELRGFFGDDLSLLKRDVLEKKALDLLQTL